MKFLFLFALVAFVSAAPEKPLVQIVVNLEKTADDIYVPAEPMPFPKPVLPETPVVPLPNPEGPIGIKPMPLPELEVPIVTIPLPEGPIGVKPMPQPELEVPIVTIPLPEGPIGVKPMPQPELELNPLPFPLVPGPEYIPEQKPQTEDMYERPQVFPIPIAKPL